ncbi:YqaJ viral recombinase family protein [Streptomyces thermolineatus]|uniref:YqaJ viral recombinase family protein n=1 Tax=Streptomyces thermolineatus TaxID=44033 RepID=A0ABN3LIS3_9ACTN
MTTTVDTPATPEGVFLGVLRPGTPEWDAARAGLTITATEIAAVVGLSPWQSRFSLWHKKAGLPGKPFESSPAMEWGVRLEDAVARKFGDNHPELHVAKTGTWRHRAREWQRATPDRLLLPTDGKSATALLEVKTSPDGGEWGEDGTDQVPIHYRCQVLWQLDTLGLDECHVAVLIGGCDYREYRISYDKGEAELLREAAIEFLDDVQDGRRPPIDGADATYQTVKAQPDGVDPDPVDIDPLLADRYRQVRADEAEVTARGRQVRAELLDAMGNHTRAHALGDLVAYRTVHPDGTTRALQPARDRTHA